MLGAGDPELKRHLPALRLLPVWEEDPWHHCRAGAARMDGCALEAEGIVFPTPRGAGMTPEEGAIQAER